MSVNLFRSFRCCFSFFFFMCDWVTVHCTLCFVCANSLDMSCLFDSIVLQSINDRATDFFARWAQRRLKTTHSDDAHMSRCLIKRCLIDQKIFHYVYQCDGFATATRGGRKKKSMNEWSESLNLSVPFVLTSSSDPFIRVDRHKSIYMP